MLKLLILLLSQSLQAAPTLVNGPELSGEITSATSTSTDTANWNNSHRGWYADLFAPLPVNSWHLQFVPRAIFYQEFRRQSGNFPTELYTPEGRLNLSTLALGGAVIFDAHDGMPEWFLWLGRYGSPDFTRSPGAMLETVAGITLHDILFGVRWRHFPNKDTFLPILSYRFDLSDGYYFNLQVPSDAILGWQAEDTDWDLSTGIHLKDRQYPVNTAAFSNWMDGNTLEFFAGVRKHIGGPFYLLWEMGIQSEFLYLHNSAAGGQTSISNNFAPWGRVTLQTLFAKDLVK